MAPKSLKARTKKKVSKKFFFQKGQVGRKISSCLDHSFLFRQKKIKQELQEIVKRRNQITHEADIDPTYGLGNRWLIDESMVNDAVDFIEQVVESIHQIL